MKKGGRRLGEKSNSWIGVQSLTHKLPGPSWLGRETVPLDQVSRRNWDAGVGLLPDGEKTPLDRKKTSVLHAI